MKRALQGRYFKVATAGESFKAFVPAPLPPRPAIVWSPALRGRFDAALLALGRLDAVTDLLPNAALLRSSFVRKEAVSPNCGMGASSGFARIALKDLKNYGRVRGHAGTRGRVTSPRASVDAH